MEGARVVKATLVTPCGATTIAVGDPREVDAATNEVLKALPNATIQRDPNGRTGRTS